MNELEQRISIDQVRVGLHIRMESWMDHPFLFSSFKIRNEKQLQQLRPLGISHVLYDSTKSDFPPFPPPKVDMPPRPPAPPDPEIEAMWVEKRANGGNLYQDLATQNPNTIRHDFFYRDDQLPRNYIAHRLM